MASTYTLISSQILGGSAASVTFSSIPSTYTDLVLRMSIRNQFSGSVGYINLTYNSDVASNYSRIHLYYLSNSIFSDKFSNLTSIDYGLIPWNDATANTFSNSEIYIPNYLSTTSKPSGSFSVSENNSSSVAGVMVGAELYRNTSAINTITFTAQSNVIASGSSFYLYGIKNS